MSIQVADNFEYKGTKPLDGRVKYATLALMKAASEATLYDGILAYVDATDKYYKFLSSNTVDADTGKWREFETGSGGSSVLVSHTGAASATGIRKQIITVDNISYDIDGTAYMEQQVTLSTSIDTVVTFSNAAIEATSEISVGTSKYDICPIDVDAETPGVCEVTFAKVNAAETITVRLCLR